MIFDRWLKNNQKVEKQPKAHVSGFQFNNQQSNQKI